MVADLVLRIDPLEHWRVLQHVRNYNKPNSASADKDVLQVTYSPVLHEQYLFLAAVDSHKAGMRKERNGTVLRMISRL